MTPSPPRAGSGPRPPSSAGGLDGGDDADDVALGVALPEQVGAQVLDADGAGSRCLDGFAPSLRNALGIAAPQRAKPLADGGGGHGIPLVQVPGEGRGEGFLPAAEGDGTIQGGQGARHRVSVGTYVRPKHKPDLSYPQVPVKGGHKQGLATLSPMGNNQLKPDAFEFKARLKLALDRIPDCPPEGVRSGRGSWLAALFDVSQTTARAWREGEYMPSPDRVRVLAEKAVVSYDWLYFGLGNMTDSAPGTAAVLPFRSDDKAAQPVRRESMKLALKLTAEARGLGAQFTPDQQSEVVSLLYELLEDGMAEADVLKVARAQVSRLHEGEKDGQTREGDKA